MALNDLYEVTLKARLFEQDVYNVFHYSQTADVPKKGASHAADLAEQFEEGFLPVLRSQTSTQLHYQEIAVRNLFQPAEKASRLLAVSGQVASSEAMPGFNAFGVRLQGSNAAVRDGQKRFAGVPEGAQAAGVIEAAYLVSLALLEDMIVSVLRDALTDLIETYTPVIVKRVIEGLKPTQTYRLPTNAAEAVVSVITGAQAATLVTSQTSRKIGKGR